MGKKNRRHSRKRVQPAAASTPHIPRQASAQPLQPITAVTHTMPGWHHTLPLLIVVAGYWAYHNSFAGTFLFDGAGRIRDNVAIRSLQPLSALLTGSTRPLVNVSFALNYAWTGLETWSYHLVNLVIHVLAGLTLFGLVRRTLSLDTLPTHSTSAASWLALSTALVWVVHPLQTQSVTYIVQRSETLMGLWYLLTLYGLVRGARGSSRWYLVATAACWLGMVSKPIMGTAPFVALLYDRAFLAKSFGEALKQRRRLYVGLASSWLLLALLLSQPNESAATAGFQFKALTPLEYALTQPGVVLHYLKLAYWPHPLCIDYGWQRAIEPSTILITTSIIIGLFLITLWAWQRHPPMGFLGAWFFLILAPTSSIIPIADVAFEHRMYLPLVAPLTFTVIGIECTLRRVPLPLRHAIAVLTLLLFVVGFGTLTIQRNRAYHTERAMWSDVVAQQPDNPRAHNNLGHTLFFDERDLTAAQEQFRAAIDLYPTYTDALQNLGAVLMELGQVEDSIVYQRKALAHNPNMPLAHYNLANALAHQGNVEQAIPHYREALKIDPNNVQAHHNLAVYLSKTGLIDEAIVHFRAASRIQPNSARVHRSLGRAVLKRGHLKEAIMHFREALRIEPNDVEVQRELQQALQRQHRRP